MKQSNNKVHDYSSRLIQTTHVAYYNSLLNTFGEKGIFMIYTQGGYITEQMMNEVFSKRTSN